MKWLNPKTNKTYGSVLEALVDFMCPGPCIDCPLNLPSRSDSGEMTRSSSPCLRYTRDNPAEAAKLMGLTQVSDEGVEDMTISDIISLCRVRSAEFKSDKCKGCPVCSIRNSPFEKNEGARCILMGATATPATWQLTSFIGFDPFMAKQVKGLYDVFGAHSVVGRALDGTLAVRLAGTNTYIELPIDWWQEIPMGACFRLSEAQTHGFVMAKLYYSWEGGPDKLPSPPLKPDAGKAGEYTDERGMLDPQSYKQGG